MAEFAAGVSAILNDNAVFPDNLFFGEACSCDVIAVETGPGSTSDIKINASAGIWLNAKSDLFLNAGAGNDFRFYSGSNTCLTYPFVLQNNASGQYTFINTTEDQNMRFRVCDGGTCSTIIELNASDSALQVGGTTANSGEIRFMEDLDNGSNYAAIKAPACIGTNYTLTLPGDDGCCGEVLTTNGSGTLTWGSSSVNNGNWCGTDLSVANGGTGASCLTTGSVLIGTGTSAVTLVAMVTKGNILAGDGSGAPRALAVGSNGTALTACSGETTGLAWASAGVGLGLVIALS